MALRDARCMTLSPLAWAADDRTLAGVYGTTVTHDVGTVDDSSACSAGTAIGVGDGDSDSDDQDDASVGNGGGNFDGNYIWAFGGESTANDGYSGMVYIHAAHKLL